MRPKPPEGRDQHQNHGEGWAAAMRSKSDTSGLNGPVDPHKQAAENSHGENYHRPNDRRPGPRGV